MSVTDDGKAKKEFILPQDEEKLENDIQTLRSILKQSMQCIQNSIKTLQQIEGEANGMST